MLNYKQIWHGIKPIRWLNKFNLTQHKTVKRQSNVPIINGGGYGDGSKRVLVEQQGTGNSD